MVRIRESGVAKANPDNITMRENVNNIDGLPCLCFLVFRLVMTTICSLLVPVSSLPWLVVAWLVSSAFNLLYDPMLVALGAVIVSRSLTHYYMHLSCSLIVSIGITWYLVKHAGLVWYTHVQQGSNHECTCMHVWPSYQSWHNTAVCLMCTDGIVRTMWCYIIQV